MAVDGSLIFDTKIDTKDFAKGTNTIKNQANGLKSTFVSLGKAIAGAFIIKKSIDLGKQATELASDLQEVQNVVDTAFGEMSDKMEQFAKTSVKSFGMSKLAAKQTGSTYMAMARNMIKSQEVASDMAVTLTGLTGDWASFYNVTTQEAATALNAIFTGETETIKRFGYIMTEANLQSYALSKGMKQRISDMTQEEKVLLRYNFIMEKSAMVQGDFAKTSGSWANQTRILKEQWKEFMTVLGQGIIQFLTPAIQFLNRAMQYMIALARATGEVLSAVFGFNIELSESTSGVSSGAEDAADNITDIGDAAEEAGKKAAKAVAPFDKLNEVANAEVTGNPLQAIDSFNPAGAIEAGGAIGAIGNNIDQMDRKIKKMAEEIKPVLQGIVDVFDKFGPAIAGIATAFITYKVIDWFSKLAGAIGAFSLGPAGIIALAIGALVAIGLGLKKLRDDAIEADLEKRFGDISLSMEEIEDIAKRMTDSEYTFAIDAYVTEHQKLEALEGNIRRDIEALNKLNWKVSVGLELTEGEIAEYKRVVESFVSNMDGYIEQQHYVTTLAINAVIQDVDFKAEISEIVDKYFNGSKGEMERLGKQLRTTMDEALADGVLDADEQKVVQNLMKEITEIQERIASAEFTAKLQSISLEGDLDADSYKKLFAEIQEQIEDRSKGAEDAQVQILTVVNAQYEIDMKNTTTQAQRQEIQRKYDADIAKIKSNLSDTKIEISQMGMTFAYDKIAEKWQPEMEEFAEGTKGLIGETMQEVIDEGMFSVDPGQSLFRFFSNTIQAFNQAYKDSGMTKAAKTNLEDFLKTLEPTAEQNQKLADEYIKTGEVIPKTLIDQLNDEGMLQALANNIDGIYYIMGQQMADSPEILTMIANGEIAGESLDDALIRGMKSKIDDLKKEGGNIVFNVDKAVETASKNAEQKTMPQYSKKIIKGYNSGFDKDASTKKSVKGWLDGINSTIKNYRMDAIKIRAEFFGLELPGITGNKQNYLKYPQYATGNVIPANYGNFLATLGDNKREPEVVSPLSTMKQAMKEAMAEMGGVGGEYTFTAQLDGKTLFKETVNQDQMQRKTTGKSAFSY